MHLRPERVFVHRLGFDQLALNLLFDDIEVLSDKVYGNQASDSTSDYIIFNFGDAVKNFLFIFLIFVRLALPHMALVIAVRILIITHPAFEIQSFDGSSEDAVELFVLADGDYFSASWAFPTAPLHAYFAHELVASVALDRVPANAEAHQANKVVVDRVSYFGLRGGSSQRLYL